MALILKKSMIFTKLSAKVGEMETPNGNREAPVRSSLPNDAIINCELVITSFFAPDGLLKYAVNITGDPNLAQAIGLCELSKQQIYDYYTENEEDEFDEDE